jgi:hypothetical protein
MPNPKEDEFARVFTALKKLVQPLAKHMTVLANTPDKFILEGAYSEEYKRKIWFGGVQRGKAYVSYHLIAVYAFPDLLKDLSPKLRARMQGKSCFNFTKLDPGLLRELGRLTKTSFARFRRAKWV